MNVCSWPNQRWSRLLKSKVSSFINITDQSCIHRLFLMLIQLYFYMWEHVNWHWQTTALSGCHSSLMMCFSSCRSPSPCCCLQALRARQWEWHRCDGVCEPRLPTAHWLDLVQRRRGQPPNGICFLSLDYLYMIYVNYPLYWTQITCK